MYSDQNTLFSNSITKMYTLQLKEFALLNLFLKSSNNYNRNYNKISNISTVQNIS